MRTVTMAERRRALVRRHHLGGDAEGPEAVIRALLALHASDPASVYLSVLARSAGSTLTDVADAMYERRNLVRWMVMRRTLFVIARDDVPMVQAAVSTPLAATLRRRLVSRLDRCGTEPPLDRDADHWLAEREAGVERALRSRGDATGAELSTDEPALRTAILPGAPSDRLQTLTSSLLTQMSADGRIVRATPTGPWTSRNHRWEPVERWWPDGLPHLEIADAQRSLARQWLARFGPATTEDLQWWTGWNRNTVRRALAGLPVEEVDLHGQDGVALGPDAGPESDAEPDVADPPTDRPVATLLPCLDPTPMGWKRRDWFLGIDPRQIFDGAGNIGPTLWWDGEVIGSWGIASGGEVRTAVLADRGSDAATAVQDAASRLQDRLGGAAVTPAIRTPVERSLTRRADGADPTA